MKPVTFSRGALKDFRKHRQAAPKIAAAIEAYAAGTGAHANNVTQLVGSAAKRLRVGDFRVIFTEDAASITVTKVAPRGSAYE